VDSRAPRGHAVAAEVLLVPKLAILPLRDVRPADAPRVGGKVAPLAKLAVDGLPVPDGFVLPAQAFRRALQAAGLEPLAKIVARSGEGAAAAELRARIDEGLLPGAWVEVLRREGRKLGGPLAVRSSGVDEDGANRSFAGQHATVLGVLPDALPAAVARCWASLYAERALAYRGGRGPDPGALAVLVQRMVPAEVSGVLFTVNPISGSWHELTIEAVWGLPEGLVSGRVAPHWYLLRRPRRTPRPVQRVLARVRLAHLDRDLPPLAQRWVQGEGGVRVEPVPAALVDRPTLSPAEALRLGRLGLRIEGRLGGAQDIEWARDAEGRTWILQARPITATGVPDRADEVLWTRRFIGERFPDPVSPLGWSIVAPVLEHHIAYPSLQRDKLGGGPALRLVHGRPYVNATVFTRLLFKLPGAAPPGFMLELLPPGRVERARRRFAVAPDLDIYAALLRISLAERRWRRFAWNPLTNPARWRAFESELSVALGAMAVLPDGERALVERVEALVVLLRRYVGIHVCSLLFASLFDQIFDGVLHSLAPEQASRLRAALAVTPPGNRTLEVNAAVWRLARALDAGDLDAIEGGREPSPRGASSLSGFLLAYGHRADASWDLAVPRWREVPARLAPLLRAQLAEPEDPASRASAQAVVYAQAREELLAELPDRALRALVPRLLDLLRDYLLLRENQRFSFELLQWEIKRAAGALAERLAARGALPSPDDHLWCTWPELCGLVDGAEPPLPVAERVVEGRARAARDAALSAPTFLSGDEVAAPPAGAARLQGQGVSPGRARGPVRRVRTLAEAGALRPGDILVAPAVDPGWTPLLAVAGGVVLELGSRLSHGAVVAREYGVPAVVNVEGALARLRDGDEVTVDGTRGVVFVHG
jgi:rifampicin phosphotransferase